MCKLGVVFIVENQPFDFTSQIFRDQAHAMGKSTLFACPPSFLNIYRYPVPGASATISVRVSRWIVTQRRQPNV